MDNLDRQPGQRKGVLVWLLAMVSTVAGGPDDRGVGANLYTPYPEVVEPAEGISWPVGQALPIFARPAEGLDVIEVQNLTVDEQLAFSSLQGLVNRKRPRILLQDARAGEGRDTWANTETVGFDIGERYDRRTKFELLKKYLGEVEGVVLFDPEKSDHYRNLAGTVAGLEQALPVSVELMGQLNDHGLKPRVVEDLSGLEFTTALEIYGYLHAKYWKECSKRLIVSARPSRRGGDHHHTRDLAAATGTAVVWLDNRIPEEREMMRKYFRDMEAGNAIALGWYSSERSGITTASEFGIGTLPADYFVSASVFSGTDHRIQIPPVPKLPKLENKVYVALFISDGDNIQYNQHAMRSVWDREAETRGKMPLTWTIAPGLVDIAPGILNYYYQTATPNDCFATGPSGMGYMMPVNTLEEEGAPVGVYTNDPERMDGYARMTETYLQRSGLRVMTIWDDASPMQRAMYEKRCRNLYGATVQNFKDVPTVRSSVENGRLPFDKLVIPYASSSAHLGGSLRREIGRWDGEKPIFRAYQVDIWGELKPKRLVEIASELKEEFGDKVLFVRGDHYFNLSKQAEGLAFNLAMSDVMTATSNDGSSDPGKSIDGTPVTVWSSEGENPWLMFDLGATRVLSRYVIRHAGEAGLDRKLNTCDFMVQYSVDGKDWKLLNEVTGNTSSVSDCQFDAVAARFIKILITKAGDDRVARVADVEIFGM